MELVKSKFSDFHFEYFENIVSKNTKDSYRRDLYQFLGFIKDFHPAITKPTDINITHILDYKNYARDEMKYAPKSIQRKLASISNYFEFLVQKMVISHNPVKSVKRGKSDVQTPTEALDDEEVLEIFKVLELSHSTLHKAALYLLFATGIRRAEVVNIRKRDFVHEKGSIFLYITGKGGKTVYKLIPGWIYEHVTNHISYLESRGVVLGPEDFILQLTRKNNTEAVTPQSIYYWIKDYGKKAGITKNISPHTLRATYITSALESGLQIHKVAEDVGHSKIDTTLSYNKRRKAKTESPVNSIPFLKNSVNFHI